MSEPNTNVDIEDVLTSIRRLVSEEAHDVVLEKVKPHGAADRLVLTPALRIAEPPVQVAEPEEVVITTVEAAPEVDEAPFVEVDPETEITDLDFTAEPEEIEFAEVEEVEVAPLRRPADNLPIDQKISELSAAFDRAKAEYEPEEGDVFGGIASPLPWAETHPSDQLSGKAAGEGPLDDDAFDEDDASDSDDEVPMFDQEVLRAMVAQIVREELQGELGERITRNVRKLIRREINRALAIQDLE
ncbi:hypothetical protein [Donghicola mangrovi]|uniref:Uncharacterized protein n=1 Tax=Donghicola mangrovi TaxID=2729614 RepID=A0A850Q4M3_9RHOB|nr:hypothetical protein [Donghicola mangrovi]NVO23904.1 hypothetical protein [Donghicola mangrovi]